jgi:hypothetical protein
LPAQCLLATSGESGKKLGAAITMNPYAAATKFVMEKNAPEKTIKKTAGDISKDIIAHLKQHEVPPSSKQVRIPTNVAERPVSRLVSSVGMLIL